MKQRGSLLELSGLWFSRIGFNERRDIGFASRRETLSMKLDALDLMQRFSRQITFATVRAANDGYVFDDEQIIALAIAFAHVADARAFFPAVVANNRTLHFHLLHTVMINNFPVKLSLPTTTMTSSESYRLQDISIRQSLCLFDVR